MLLEIIQSYVNEAAKILRTTPKTLALAIIISAMSAIAITSVSRSAKKKIPGPRGLPLFGSALEIRRYSKKSKVFEFFDAVTAEFGPIAVVTGPGMYFIVTNNAELVHLALTDTSNFKRGTRVHNSTVGIGENLLFALPSGDTWKMHRKYLQPAFAPSHLRFVGTVTENEIDRLLDFWNNKISANSPTGIVVDFHHSFTCVALDILGHVAFSYDFKSVDAYHEGRDGEGHEMLLEFGKVLSERNMTPPFTWNYYGLGSNGTRAMKFKNYFNRLLDEIIEKKQQNKTPAGNKDLLDRLLDIDTNNNQKFTKAEIFGEALGFLFAGHE
ncbi:hypothetical protein HK100_005024 [Physocladia obscura]|uniref:Cytochrome P450 n=1 Tax=Physocladia obscura TaxID=109957 RepID=A0AAD5XDI4_9FUNG|nr:hypothetical protein HK100_005024 [Physocladia obscura]